MNYLMLKKNPCKRFVLDCLAPQLRLNYANYLVQFELLYINIHNSEVLSNEDLTFVKVKTKETALSSLRQCNKNPQ